MSLLILSMVRSGHLMGDIWDAGQYLRFGGERARPFFDLVAHVGAADPS
jgi:hypothetical protein